ncbi:hypothetical protein DPMN_165067 [Dreissena polymorpha]|uniref:Macro domain-containing protein n=1 Tax=Dreissena polymorpha TaxID=45954 RepID=A0A9D4IW11_DREPO|nr:hypothetical protein DPMN_165067 [Dreissena polymorpha]
MKHSKAVLNFCTLHKETSSLREIHFVDVKDETVKGIQTMFDCMIRDNKQEPYQPSDFLPKTQYRRGHTENMQYSAIPINQQGAFSGSMRDNEQHLSAPLQYETVNNKNGAVIHKLKSCEMKQNIICYQCNILEAHVDSIVVVIDKKGEPGVICRALKKKMTDVNRAFYESTLEDKCKKNFNVNDVIETLNFGSHFKYILHVVLPMAVKSMSSKERIKIMKATYQKLYKKINDNVMTRSIAVALLAVGKTLILRLVFPYFKSWIGRSNNGNKLT